MTRLFNTKELKIEKGNKTLLIPQKRSGNLIYMNTIIDEHDHDWLFTRAEAEKLYRHLGGMLGKETEIK
jgi:hypothetical protein